MSVRKDDPRPQKVALLVLPHASFLSVASTLDPLRCANRHLGYEAFTWVVVSPGLSSVPLTCGLALPCSAHLEAAVGADILLVIAGFRVDEVTTRPLIKDIQRVAAKVGTLGAIDSGAWILAKAGLLAGYRATTHWEDQEDFAAAFPDTHVLPDRFVIDRNRITAGGAAPAFDMMVDLIGRLHGPRLSLEVATSFITDTVEASRPQVRPILNGKEIDPRLAEAIRIMTASVDAPLKCADLAARLGLSARRLEALFREGLGDSPGAFYLELRLQAARRMLADTRRQPMAVIALRAGFSCPSSLSRAFTRRFGESARDFRQRRMGFSGNGMVS